MRLIVIDASPINGGPASYAVDVAASSAEQAGAEVVRVRLYDVLNYACLGCNACGTTGRCTKRDGLLAHAGKVMAMADSVVIGAPAKLRGTTGCATAMMSRFLGAYAGLGPTRGRRRPGSLAEGKRAAVLASGGLPGFAAAAAGLGVAGAARALLVEAGVTLLPSTYVPSRFTNASTRDITREAAEKLARKLVAPEQPEHRKPPRGGRRRVPAREMASPLETGGPLGV
jgi:multimeric flavodoxin WrbA